jgi:hypothetical protein
MGDSDNMSSYDNNMSEQANDEERMVFTELVSTIPEDHKKKDNYNSFSWANSIRDAANPGLDKKLKHKEIKTKFSKIDF